MKEPQAHRRHGHFHAADVLNGLTPAPAPWPLAGGYATHIHERENKAAMLNARLNRSQHLVEECFNMARRRTGRRGVRHMGDEVHRVVVISRGKE